MDRRSPAFAGPLLAVLAILTACSGDTDASVSSTPAPADSEAAAAPDEELEGLQREVIEGYADGVAASYLASLESATEMDAAIDAFLDDPTGASLEAAKEAWLTARDDYGPTEAFRFYGGPIDDEEDGVEGLVNAWPLDEAYIDYTESDPESGIVNDPDGFDEITTDTLMEANEAGGEANVSTGWHAIEFLLWGQDLSDDGPGERPVTDYTTATNADRRAAYLATTSGLLLTHLEGLVAAWDEGGYRDEFLALPDDEALTLLTTGIGELSRGELAGERLSVAYFERSQEDEHSCFSDNTHADAIGNAEGVRRVIEGDYPDTDVPGLADLVAAVDPEMADALRAEVDASLEAAEGLPVPFDGALREDLGDDDPGRVAVLATIESLEGQTETLVRAADLLGLSPALT